eukprot:621659-Karenia_brevis.AAC.1
MVNATLQYQRMLEDTTQEAYWAVHKYDWDYCGKERWYDGQRKYYYHFYDDRDRWKSWNELDHDAALLKCSKQREKLRNNARR